MRIPAGAALPHTLKKLCVFACFRGGRGRVPFRLVVIHAASGDRVGRAREVELDFTNPNATVYGRFMFEDVAFPAFGTYTVELFCDGLFFDDQTIQVLPTEG